MFIICTFRDERKFGYAYLCNVIYYLCESINFLLVYALTIYYCHKTRSDTAISTHSVMKIVIRLSIILFQKIISVSKEETEIKAF